MAAICGIVSLDGTHVPQDDFAEMMEALAHHGPQRVQFEHIGLAILGRRAEIISHDPLEPSCANFPNDEMLVVANARLDNRTDLLKKLETSEMDTRVLSDCALICAAYEKWGERCPEYLLGDFVFAIWDKRNRRLFCGRDHMGIRSLFFYADGMRFVFASEPKSIAAASFVPNKANLRKLATLGMPDARPLFWDQSWFENIHPVPAGSTLTVYDGETRVRKYWAPSLSTRLPIRGEEETFDGLQSLIFEAVRTRLPAQGPVTAMLSGGLDSAAITATAARILSGDNREIRVVSAVLPESAKPGLKDERDFIDQFRDWPNVRIEYVDGGQRGPFDNLEELVWGSDSVSITSRHYLYSALSQATVAGGGRTILDGQGGELGVSCYDDGWYPELLTSFQWGTLWRELRARKRVSGNSILQGLRRDALRPLLPQQLLEWRHSEKHAQEAFQRRQPLLPEFFHDQLATAKSQLADVRRAMYRPAASQREAQHRLISNVQAKAASVAGYVGYGSVEMSYPLMDKRLLEYCLAVPGDMKTRNGFTRYLVRRGLDKILPAAIQWRTTKCAFSPDYFSRYNAQREKVKDILSSIRTNDPVRTIVDVERLKRLAALDVKDSDHGTFPGLVALESVPAGIYLIHFLRRFAEFRN